MSGSMNSAATGFPRFALIFSALFVLSALPVALSDLLPLVDYPNHLARMYILAHLPTSPTLQAFYAVEWGPIPDLAMDSIVPTLSRVVPLIWAGKLFVLLTFLLLTGGVAALNRVLFGRWTAWPCLAFLLLYNRVFLWGFLNYLFGVGLALCATALWIALRGRGIALRLVVGVVLALAVYFSHLMAFGVYGLLLGGYEAGLLWRRRAAVRVWIENLAVAGMPFIPPFLILLLGSPALMSATINFGSFGRKFDMPFSVFDNYSRPFDIACFAVACIGLAVAFWRRWIRLAPGMGPSLFLLTAAFLLLPSQLFTASGADHRLPVAIALAIVGATSWEAPHPAGERRFLAAAGVLLVIRLGVVAAAWQATEREYAPVVAAFDRVPVGSRIAVAFPGSVVHAGGIPMVHLPVWAIAEREAFVPTLEAYANQQPVRLQTPYQELANAVPPGKLWNALALGSQLLTPALRDQFERYDFVIFVGAKPFTVAAGGGLEPAYMGSLVKLYRLTHQTGASNSAKAPAP